MKIRFIAYLLLTLLFAYSCGDDDTTYASLSPSKDAQIYSFSLAANHIKKGDSLSRAQDSLRFVEFNKTKFAIDQINSTIYNPDSLPYGLKLGMAKMTLTYNPSYGVSKVEIDNTDSIASWNTTDSVDFSKKISIKISAPDNSSTKTYAVDMRIHQIDPDTLPWKKAGRLPVDADEEKILLKDNVFYSYSKQGNVLALHTSDIPDLNWIKQSGIVIPGGIVLNSITTFNGKFYGLLQNGESCSSADGKIWTVLANNKNIVSILGVLPGTGVANSLLVAFVEDGKYYFGTSADLTSVDMVTKILSSPNDNTIKAGFSILGAASAANFSSDRSVNLLMMTGGKDKDGTELNTSWLVRNTADGLEISPSQTTYFKGEGLAAMIYDSKLYVLSGNQFYISSTWGRRWAEAPNKQKLDPAIPSQTHQSVIVDSKNNIWLFGGITKDAQNQYDIWRGRLNKLNVN